MDNKRNRELIEYLISLGIKMNVGVNKARGNRGYFKAQRGCFGIENFTITISKGMTDDEITRVLVHEFAHYFHYMNDKTLKSLDFFINQDMSVELHEEFLNLTVDIIPKEFAKKLFDEKERVKNEINKHFLYLKEIYPDIQKSKPLKDLENKIKKSDFKYLLKYDRVRICGFFADKIYTINNLKEFIPDVDDSIIDYLKLKSKQRLSRRINNRISRLNKYYNSPTEIFARSMEVYLLEGAKMRKNAPKLCEKYDNQIQSGRFNILNKFIDILDN